MSDTTDHQDRRLALTLAVDAHTTGGHDSAILATATRYLGWLRRPTPAATLTLRVGDPTEKGDTENDSDHR